MEGLAEQLPPLSDHEAVVESNRCLYCFDAPCAHACPTHIDIPRFITRIATGNLTGSARTILESNLLGATCARVCPVQELCEGACVLNVERNPIRIGRLQRYAMDHIYKHPVDVVKRAPPTGRIHLSCRTRNSFTCMATLISPISSRKTVPPAAISKRPRLL